MEFIKVVYLFLHVPTSFSHFQSTLHLMQYRTKTFSPLLKTVFELVNFGAF